MRKRIKEENVKEFVAKYDVKGKEYTVNFYEFPVDVRIRLAIKGLKMLLGASTNPDALLESLGQGRFPGEKHTVKYPLYVEAVSEVKQISREEAQSLLAAMPPDDKRELLQSKAVKQMKLLLQAKHLEENGHQGH